MEADQRQIKLFQLIENTVGGKWLFNIRY